jgi:hypothetical protein
MFTDTINKNTETLIDASKEVGLEVNVQKTKYILVPRDQNAGQNRDIKIGYRSFENVSQFKYLGMAIANQNLIQEEIKRRLNSGNACCHSVQNLSSCCLLGIVRSRTKGHGVCLFFFCLLSKNVKVRIYKTIILPLVPYMVSDIKGGTWTMGV